MEKIVKPAHDGLIVRYPKTFAILPANGAQVTFIGVEGRYWRRRVNDGSVKIISRISHEQTKKISKPEIKSTIKKEGKDKYGN